MKNNLHIKNVIWNIVGISANSFYSLLLTIIVTQMNGVEINGVFSSIFYLSATFQQIGSFGGRLYQVSDTSQKYSASDYTTLKYIANTIMFILAIIFCFISPYNMESGLLLLVLIGYRAFENIQEAFYGVLQKNNKLYLIGMSMTGKVLISSIAFMIVNATTKNILFASFSFVLGYGITLFIFDSYNVKSIEKIKLNYNKNILLLMLDSSKVFIFSFCNVIMLNMSRYVVAFRLDDYSQGYFTNLIMPASIISLFAQFVIQPMIKELVDNYSKGDIKSFTNHIKIILSVIVLGGIVGSCIAYFILPELLGLIYSRLDFTNYRIEAFLVILAGTCSGATSVISNLLVIMRRQNAQLCCYLVCIIFSLVISLRIIHFSVTEAISCYIASMVFMLVLFFVIFIYYINIVNKEHKNNGKSLIAKE